MTVKQLGDIIISRGVVLVAVIAIIQNYWNMGHW